MNLQEQHWTNLFGNLTTESSPWYGTWTVYSPEKEVIKSSQGMRILHANEDKTVITHTNQFPSPDGSIQEKQWQIEKKFCNQPDGLLHPADSSKRALSLLGYGSSAWVPKKLEVGRAFSVELFLKHQDSNDSIGSIYGETGCLEKILHIREHLGSFPNPAGPEIGDLPGKWSGKRQSITPNLEILPAEETLELVLDANRGKNENFFLPDGIVLNIPKIVKLGEEFAVVASKLISDNEYKRLIAKYDNLGSFTMLISEVFRRTE